MGRLSLKMINSGRVGQIDRIEKLLFYEGPNGFSHIFVETYRFPQITKGSVFQKWITWLELYVHEKQATKPFSERVVFADVSSRLLLTQNYSGHNALVSALRVRIQNKTGKMMR